jgi:ATP-dependent RNA helicase MSS116
MEVIWDLMSSKTANKNMSNENHKKKNKVMVFFPMTSLVQLYADIFNFRFGKRVWELHGKMYQRERSVVSRRFRNAPDGVLFTSDVSARGIDYPNVTHVVQVGAPQSRETYIHRLGRTGRAGKHGEGLLILPELEKSFIEDLIESPTAPFSQSEECSNYVASMNIQHDDELQRQLLRSSRRKGSYYQQLQEELGQLRHDMHRQTDGTISSSLYLAYQAMISYYFQSSDRNRSDDDIVAFINQLVADLGSNELPAVDELRAKRLGIDTIPSLNIKRNWKERRWKGDWIDGNHGSDRDGRNDGGDDYGVDRDAHNHENSCHRQAHFHRIPVGNFEHAFDGNREDGLSRKEGGFRRHDREIGNRSDPSRSNNSKFTDHKFDNDRLSKSSIRRGADDKFRRTPKRANDFRRRANNFFQRWEQPGVFRTKS